MTERDDDPPKPWASDPEDRLHPGDTVAEHFKIMKQIGRGGQAEIYEAFDVRRGARVALKILQNRRRYDKMYLKRAKREADALLSFRHTNIVHTSDVVMLGGDLIIVMELLRGDTWTAELRGHQRLPVGVVLSWATQLADALSVLHVAGTVHRDVKPANVMITPATGADPEDLITLIDLGALRMMAQGLGSTSDKHTIGTASYMSPEHVANADVDERADVYPVGLMMYESLVGTHPHELNGPLATMEQRLEKQRQGRFPKLSELMPDLPPPVLRVIDRALSFEREKRHRNAEELARDLRACTVALQKNGQLGATRLRDIPAVVTPVGSVVIAVGKASPTMGYDRTAEVSKPRASPGMIAKDTVPTQMDAPVVGPEPELYVPADGTSARALSSIEPLASSMAVPVITDRLEPPPIEAPAPAPSVPAASRWKPYTPDPVTRLAGEPAVLAITKAAAASPRQSSFGTRLRERPWIAVLFAMPLAALVLWLATRAPRSDAKEEGSAALSSSTAPSIESSRPTQSAPAVTSSPSVAAPTATPSHAASAPLSVGVPGVPKVAQPPTFRSAHTPKSTSMPVVETW